MTEELSNKKLMLTEIRAFKEGDTAPLFAAVSPDIIWKSNAPPEFFRGGGETTGLAEMKARIALVFSQYTFVRFQPPPSSPRAISCWGSSRSRPFTSAAARR